jgi:hypothetical protein
MELQPQWPEIQTYHTTNQYLDNHLPKTTYYKPLPLTRRSRFVQRHTIPRAHARGY